MAALKPLCACSRVVPLRHSVEKSGLNLLQGAKYYVTLQAWNNANMFIESSSNGVLVDETPPVAVFVTDGINPNQDADAQMFSNALVANWRCTDEDGTEIIDYELA